MAFLLLPLAAIFLLSFIGFVLSKPNLAGKRDATTMKVQGDFDDSHVINGTKIVICTDFFGACTNSEKGITYQCGGTYDTVSACNCGDADTCIGEYVLGDMNCQNAKTCIGYRVSGSFNGNCAETVVCQNLENECNAGSAKTVYCSSSLNNNVYVAKGTDVLPQNSSYDDFGTPYGTQDGFFAGDCHVVENGGNSVCLSPGDTVGIVIGVLLASGIILFACYYQRKKNFIMYKSNNPPVTSPGDPPPGAVIALHNPMIPQPMMVPVTQPVMGFGPYGAPVNMNMGGVVQGQQSGAPINYFSSGEFESVIYKSSTGGLGLNLCQGPTNIFVLNTQPHMQIMSGSPPTVNDVLVAVNDEVVFGLSLEVVLPKLVAVIPNTNCKLKLRRDSTPQMYANPMQQMMQQNQQTMQPQYLHTSMQAQAVEGPGNYAGSSSSVPYGSSNI